MRIWFKIASVLLGAVFITALGIDAADTIMGSRSTLLATLSFRSEPTLCPVGMVPYLSETETVCIDQYEAGVGSECPFQTPSSMVHSTHNIEVAECIPLTVPGVLPWRFVTYRQAEQLCARAGKSLITPEIWYKAALGTPTGVTACVTEGILTVTGYMSNCQSGIGAFDMIGNAWEIVLGEVKDGMYQNQPLPKAGYVSAVSDDGLPSVTSELASQLYQSDYFWLEASGTYAIMRGGYYGGRSDAGLYSTHAAVTQDFASDAVGFRCIKRLAQLP
jgi:hypothetical protein